MEINVNTLIRNMSLRQTCKVRIQGRQQRYRRALETIQNEEYLSSIGEYFGKVDEIAFI